MEFQSGSAHGSLGQVSGQLSHNVLNLMISAELMVRRSDRWGNTESCVLGELQLWINGECVIHAKGLIFREDEASHIKGMHFQTFFGGAQILPLLVVW